MTSRIEYDNTWATLSAEPTVKALVREYLTFRVNGYQFTTAFKKKRWDGYKCIYQGTSNRFPAGLAPVLSAYLRTRGHEVDLVDLREKPEAGDGYNDGPPLVLPGGGTLQPHQDEAVNRILQATRGVVHHPVGAGKSIVIVEAVRRLGLPSLVLVGRKELLHQQYEAFVNFVPAFAGSVGKMGDGVKEGAYWTVGTIQTLTKMLGSLHTWEQTVEWLKRFSAVFIDECHHLPAASYNLLLRALPNAYYRIGLSATPFSTGDAERELGVTGLTGPVISMYDSSDGIEMGRLVPADVFLVDPGPYVLPKGLTDYRSEVEYGIIEAEDRNDTIVKIAEALGPLGPTLVLTERIEHGRNLRAKLLDAGHQEIK